MQKNENGTVLISLIHIKSKWLKDFNVSSEPFNSQKKTGKNVGICLSNDFMDMPPKTEAMKAKINKWDYTKLKGFFSIAK